MILVTQRAEELTQSLSSLNKKVAEAGYTKKVYMHILERTKVSLNYKNVASNVGRLQSFAPSAFVRFLTWHFPPCLLCCAF